MFLDFLKISRGAIDDSINQNLNALITPAKDGFDPNSTSQRDSRTTSRLINPGLCVKFKDKVLFPSWQTRTGANMSPYCSYFAAEIGIRCFELLRISCGITRSGRSRVNITTGWVGTGKGKGCRRSTRPILFTILPPRSADRKAGGPHTAGTASWENHKNKDLGSGSRELWWSNWWLGSRPQ